ncbi:HNH endonuclease signature motif containing protein [Arthrobacter sp. zg-Y1110]|uniref:HNH endonuclease signature motif containing protein n=1 Tax=Arthrobacter sp. zg-Y1110 TaxID=2886932 RepID=UPI001D15E2AB|nr:HNH endonuclease signature motif containing protein [Arthrobacter sp. zg-Y1110]MCC3291888.1 HNH endonuclease [Arthrobacter sp. zg-Y1110]UWX85716.1 HNH endonuclease [Arthrobacter sp. zg-Y1110]
MESLPESSIDLVGGARGSGPLGFAVEGPSTPGTGVHGVVRMDPAADMDPAAALDALTDLARLKAWTDAQTVLVVERVKELVAPALEQYGRGPMHVDDVAATEVACALNVSGRTALALVKESYALSGDFRRTLGALSRGECSYPQAREILHGLVGVPSGCTEGLEAELLEAARDLPPARLAAKARRLREVLHPESVGVRRRRAESDRCIRLFPDQDGMSWLNAYLPAEQAEGIFRRLTNAARSMQSGNGPVPSGQRGDQDRNLAQLRADLFCDLLTGSSSDGAGLQAQVLVTVPVLTLLGLSDQPGDLEGYGPIDPDTARKLAAGAGSFLRLLTDPVSGAALALDRKRYRVPKDLRTWIRVRDRTCRFPGCGVSAGSCEADHTVPWCEGGATDHGNLGSWCRKHHKLKSEALWKADQPTPGEFEFRSVLGRRYQTRSDPPTAAVPAGFPAAVLQADPYPDPGPPPF